MKRGVARLLAFLAVGAVCCGLGGCAVYEPAPYPGYYYGPHYGADVHYGYGGWGRAGWR